MRFSTRRLSLPGATCLAVALVVFRSVVWIYWEQSHFDSDHAIVGLMATHLAEGRTFPLLFYGQSYMLGVEAWLAAPLFWLFGPSLALLRIAGLALNLTVAILLLRILVREVGLAPIGALCASLFFILAPVIASSKLMETAGGDIEPFLWILLLWIARDRPIAFGLIGGFGFMNREFTAYGIVAIVLLECSRRAFFRWKPLRSRAFSFLVMAVVLYLIERLKHHAALLGPGTAGAPSRALLKAHAVGALDHLCWNASTLPSNVRWLFSQNLATLFGARVDDFHSYFRSSLTGGHPWVIVPLAVIACASVLAITATFIRRRDAEPVMETGRVVPGPLLVWYLVVVGSLAVLFYVTASCEVQDIALTRYTMLALFAPIGLVAWLLRARRPLVPKSVIVACVLLWAAASAVDHVRLLNEYIRRPPPDEFRDLTHFLEANEVRYGRAPYWTAYAVDFLSDEHITLAATDFVRISEYNNIVDQHEDQAYRITMDEPCTDAGALRFERWCLARDKR